jgi:hypothetical protein
MSKKTPLFLQVCDRCVDPCFLLTTVIQIVTTRMHTKDHQRTPDENNKHIVKQLSTRQKVFFLPWQSHLQGCRACD